MATQYLRHAPQRRQRGVKAQAPDNDLLLEANVNGPLKGDLIYDQATLPLISPVAADQPRAPTVKLWRVLPAAPPSEH